MSAAGPRLWNDLPPGLRRPGLTFDSFRQYLKTHLFGDRRRCINKFVYLSIHLSVRWAGACRSRSLGGCRSARHRPGHHTINDIASSRTDVDRQTVHRGRVCARRRVTGRRRLHCRRQSLRSSYGNSHAIWDHIVLPATRQM